MPPVARTIVSVTTPVARRGLDVAAVRAHFPALERTIDGQQVAFLDGPAGTQLPRECISAMTDYLHRSNANHGGAFAASRETDALIAEARAAMADLLGAHEADEITFGPNMTTITFALSRAIARDLRPGDELMLTRMEHDANLAPWLAIAAERDLSVRWLEVRAEDATLDLDALDRTVNERTKLVAVGLASNAVGTINDVGRVIEAAHAHRAMVFVDAVHAAPHLPIDVANLQADLLVCSPYKFYAPHLGVLYGRREHLERLRSYRVRPSGGQIPAAWETGTQSHEALAGLLGTVDYLAALGRAYGSTAPEDDRRGALGAAMSAIRSYERDLVRPLLEGLLGLRGVTVLGVTDPARGEERVPTVAFRVDGVHPDRVAQHLAQHAINAWSGDMYAPELMRALGVDDAGGVVRVGLVHYNTRDEIDRLVAAVAMLIGD
jgi:cysteine desulfurase family protein (TIGR01976 family)